MLNKFRSSGRSKGTNLVVWLLLGLLMVGLTGLGLGGAVSGLANQNVAQVGDEDVNREDFVRTLQDQMQALSRSFGQPINMSQAQLFGLDEQVLSQLITRAALDGQVRKMGLSVGDELVAEQLRGTQTFQGASGGFDPQIYDFYLERNGLSAGEFEDRLRADATRSMFELGLAAGTELPPVAVETVLAFTGEERSYSVLTVDVDDLEALPEETDDATLRAYYDANPETYTSEETRVVTYASLQPGDLVDEVEVPHADLEAAYEARAAQYNRPEARVVDRLAFGTEEEAAAAKAAIDAGETSFGAVVAERGLTAADVSDGPIEATDLGSAARELVFGAAEPGVYGPVSTDLGPTLFQLNAIVAAQTTSFEEAEAELRAALALERAAEEVYSWIDPTIDLVASGATLEELTDETPMTLGTLSLTATPDEGLAGDLAFRRDAFEAEVGQERDVVELDGGGIALLRLERIEEPALIPFDEVSERVLQDWRGEQVQIALIARAQALQAEVDGGTSLSASAAEAGLPARDIGPITRNADPESDLPADTLNIVFDLEDGATTVVSEGGQAHVIRLNSITPVDTSSSTYAERRDAVSAQLNGAVAASVYLGFAQMVTDIAGVSINQQLIDDTLALYP